MNLIMKQSILSSAAAGTLVGATVLAAVLALSPLSALADNTACSSVGDKTTVQGVIARGDCRITQRDTSLSNGLTRIAQMNKVATSTKDELTQNLNNAVSALATIKTKLDADTDLTVAKTDYRSIFNSVRVYLLLLPQTWIVAASDRAETIVTKLQTLHDALQAKVTALPDGSVKTQAQALLDSMASATQDAVQNSDAAAQIVLPLTPDNGDKTVRDSNTATVQSARGNIQTAKTDLTNAVGDAKQVRDLLKTTTNS